MAEIEFYADESDDTQDDGYGFDDGLGEESDENLTPLQRLQKYIDSVNIFNRQMVARGLLDTLRAVGTVEEDAVAVLHAMVKISQDMEPTVRSELMEQVPHIAVYCQDNIELFKNSIPMYILPMVVEYLNDGNNQVRKTSQAALLVLLEQELVEKADIEEQVVQVILDLASPDSLDDYRTEAVALMSKMSPLLGKDITERQFLSRYCEMCTDPLFHVRKVCAANFGELCAVVGTQNTEEYLLPKFYYLCEDGVWGVRKACAECFMNVSCAASLEIRKNDLARLFVNLLYDQSRWVKMAAFQQLGPFISTFADPISSGVVMNPDGSIGFINEFGEEQTGADAEQNLKRAAMEALGCDIDDLELFKDTADSSSEDEEDMSPLIVVDDDNAMDIEDVCDGSPDQDSSPDPCEKSVEEVRAESYKCDHPETTVESAVAVDGGEAGAALEEIETAEYDRNVEKAADNSNVSNNLSQSLDNFECTVEAVPEKLKDTNQSVADTSNSSPPVNDLSGCGDYSQNSSTELDNQVLTVSDDRQESFNSFQFWRPPFPQVDLDFDLVDGAPTAVRVSYNQMNHMEMNVVSNTDVMSTGLSTTVDVTSDKQQSGNGLPRFGDIINIDRSHIRQNTTDVTFADLDGLAQDLNSSSISYIDCELSMSSHESIMEHTLVDDATLAQQQDIVPQSLLENYLGMVDPSRAQTVDTEITRHCAYNLPAVAYTLGRQNWHCIKNLYETLAQDMQVNEWKVRRTLAFSLHEMAMILGEDITHKDLVPVFNGFLRDLDEVRIGVLKHLADFLRLLRPEIRQRYLKKVEDFMATDNHRNWRFRMELAVQLVLLCELYSPQDIRQHIVPMSLALASDKVSEVRHMAYRLLSIILHRMFEEGEENLMKALISEMVEKFALSVRWIGRQIFAQICHVILEENALPPVVVAEELLPNLLQLGTDPIPNVRLSTAKVLSQSIVPLEFFTSHHNPHHEELLTTLQKLQTDTDRDVRFFVTQPAETTISLHDTVPV